MIDWPNAITGFFFGVLTTLMFWIPDRIQARRQRHAEIWESWKVAMKDIEHLMWRRETRARDIYIARTKYPIDLWRSVLKEPEGFKLLERLQTAYASFERIGKQREANPPSTSYLQFELAETEWKDARTAFANYSRRAQTRGYTEVLRHEERTQAGRDFLRNPLRFFRQSRSQAK